MKRDALDLTRTLVTVAVAALFVSACGGGKDESTTTQAPASGPTAAPTLLPSDQEAVRFLSQATMGASPADLARLKQIGINNWIEEQFAAPRTSHLDFVIGEIGLDGASGAQITIDPLYRSWWKQAITGNDQLRQRMTFALSQIVVTSAADAGLQNRPAALAGHLDVLSKAAATCCRRHRSTSWSGRSPPGSAFPPATCAM